MISDHVGIMIEIKEESFIETRKREREKYIDKGWLKMIARQFVKEFIEATNMKEIYQAFKNRIEKGIKYHPKKPKPIIEIIQKLEENIVE